MTQIRSAICVLILCCSITATAQDCPTGTYILGDGLKQGDTDKAGYFGKIRIKQIGADRIAVSFYVNSGKPAFNSGSFVDTLVFRKGQAIYRNSDFDSSCRITFTFLKSRLLIKQTSKTYPSPCGFGWDVIATGTYRRISAKAPRIVDLSRDE